jgi:hypothetical protein
MLTPDLALDSDVQGDSDTFPGWGAQLRIKLRSRGPEPSSQGQGGGVVEGLWYVGSRRGGHRGFVTESDRIASRLLEM